MAESSLFSAGGHLPLTQAVPGNLRTGHGGPAGPPYGRTEHGRSRGARGRTSRVRKGVKSRDLGVGESIVLTGGGKLSEPKKCALGPGMTALFAVIMAVTAVVVSLSDTTRRDRAHHHAG